MHSGIGVVEVLHLATLQVGRPDTILVIVPDLLPNDRSAGPTDACQ